MLSRSERRILLATAVAMTGAAYGQTPAAGSSEPVSTDIAALQQQLYDPAVRQDQRDQAAQRLRSRPDPAAHTAITDALQQYGQPNVQLAAARALADRPLADPKLKDLLFPLLDTNYPEPLIEAAAHALTAFKTDDDVLNRLLGLARNANDERVRVAAVRAVSTFVDLRVAQVLIDLLDPAAGASPLVRQEAAKGLGYLSGLDASQTTVEGWRDWWNGNKAKPALQFRADMAMSRSAQYDRSQQAVLDVQSEFVRVLSEQYKRLPADQRGESLVRYLRSPESTVRLVGCRIVRISAENGEIPPIAVKEPLRQLVGDASPPVRTAAGEALALINDPAALTPLLTQLNQETDAAARGALLKALRPIGDPRATSILLSSLNDPSPDVATAAAYALAALGPKLRQSNPNVADAAAQKLMATLTARTTPHDDNDLRYALVQAMVPLQSRNEARTYMKLAASPTEVPRVRRELLNAMGELHDPQLADTIASSMSDADSGVRLAAVKALGASGISLGAYDGPLSNLIAPDKGAPAEIRDAAWNVLTNLFTKASPEQLAIWESMPGVKDDPIRLQVVYKEERARARAAGDLDTVARKNQQIGEQAAKANQWSDAVVADLDALNFALQTNKSFMIEQVCEDLTKAYLAQRQYDVAIEFVQQQIKRDPSLEGTLGPILRMEAERLINDSKDYDASLQLISLVLNMKPGTLRGVTIRGFQDLQSQVQRRSREQNLTPDPGMDRSVTT